MSSNIIPFVLPAEKQGSRELPADRAKEEQEHEHKQRSQELVQLNRLREQISREKSEGRKGPIFGRNELILAAQAVDRLVGKVCTLKGAKISDIQECLTGNLARLERFRVDLDLQTEQLSETDLTRIRKRLTQKIEPYLELTRILAHHYGLDAIEEQIAILRPTVFARFRQATPETDALDLEAAGHLTLRLNAVAQRVIRQTALVALFRRMQKIPGIWSFEEKTFRRSEMRCLRPIPYAGWNEYWGEAPPLPSVPLMRFLHSVVPLDVIVGEDPGVTPRKALLGLFRQIGLALGPTSSVEQIGPLYETRPYFELVFVDTEDKRKQYDLGATFGPHLELVLEHWTGAQLRPNHTVENLAEHGRTSVRDGDAWKPIRSIGPLIAVSFEQIMSAVAGNPAHHPFLWDFYPLEDERWGCEYWYFSWTPVRADYTAYWLDRDTDLPGTCRTLLEPGGSPASPLYPSGTIASEVECAIASNALEKDLRSAVTEIRTAFERWEQQWRESAARETDRLVNELTQDASAEADGLPE
ncbi:MAG: hypothetical protein KIT81_00540 [Alphaproteobacteria bacterium]|nr:hypothetical protein [Alphaproteobacteria bacterium]